MDIVKRLLKNEGVVIAHEPTRDRVTKGNAVFHDLLLSLLSVNNGFFNKKEIPENEYELNKSIDQNYRKLKYETEDGTKLQSVNDNEAGYKEMHFALTNNFTQIKLEDRYAFFHEVIGGLRFEEQINLKLARYLRDIDALLCQNGVLQATEFFFVGRKVST
jgi:hypothetical protein